MPTFEMGPQALPTMIPGPDGTTCVNPAIFHELIAYSDAKLAVLIFFILGLLIGAGIIYARVWLDRKEEEDAQ